MSKSRMRGHFRYLRFKTFSMTPRTPQCEVFWSSKSSSEFSGVLEDSNPNFFQVLGFTLTLGQSRVATSKMVYIIFWFSFCYSFDHGFLSLFPFDQLLDQLKIHNCNLISKFSMIWFGDHHGGFIYKILHFIFLIDNGQNCKKNINIL